MSLATCKSMRNFWGTGVNPNRPPGCYKSSTGWIAYNHDNTGMCTTLRQCVCAGMFSAMQVWQEEEAKSKVKVPASMMVADSCDMNGSS